MFCRGVLILLCAVTAACGESTGEAEETLRSETAVAHVNGVAIEEGEVLSRAQTNGLSAREALSEMVDEELLYQLSLSEHGGEAADLSLDEKRLAVHALMHRVIEAEVTVEGLDVDIIQEQSRLVAEARSVGEVRVATVLSVPFGSRTRSRGDAEGLSRELCGRLMAGEASESLRGSVGTTIPDDVMVQEDENFQETTEDPIAGMVFGIRAVGNVSEGDEVGDFTVCARLERIIEGTRVLTTDVEEEVRRDYLRHQRLRRVVLLAEGAAERFGVERFEENIDFALTLDLNLEAGP